jgi:hypothetical protein
MPCFVNPRPTGFGNTNNFPSKLFDYMQLGRAVLSSTTPTLRHAFGDALIWYDAGNPQGLSQALVGISERSTADIVQKGDEPRDKHSAIYSWNETVKNIQQWIGSL